MTVKRRVAETVVALGVGAGAALAWHAFNKVLVYKAYFGKSVWDRPKTIMCTRHPGCGLLLWTDGSLRCWYCGQEKYAGTDVRIQREGDRVRDWIDSQDWIRTDPRSILKGHW